MGKILFTENFFEGAEPEEAGVYVRTRNLVLQRLGMEKNMKIVLILLF